MKAVIIAACLFFPISANGGEHSPPPGIDIYKGDDSKVLMTEHRPDVAKPHVNTPPLDMTDSQLLKSFYEAEKEKK